MSDLLKVKNLTTVFMGDSGKTTPVDHVDFSVKKGEFICIVGESGCGKSVTSLSIMGLLGKGGAVTDGSVLFMGKELLKMTEKEVDKVRGNEMAMIFQNPLTSLNPVFTIGWQIIENIRAHSQQKKEDGSFGRISKANARKRAIELLTRVGMPDAENVMKKFPHMLSGGMRQRVMIAMELSCNPKLLIADEPTTALDVTIQAQIMALLKELSKENEMSVILITHDIGLVAQMADRVFVMYAGQMVEEAPVEELFRSPKHPYTKALLDTVPTIKDQEDRKLTAIAGMVPENYEELIGCRFRERCPYCEEKCAEPQENQEFGLNHFARCVVMKERENTK